MTKKLIAYLKENPFSILLLAFPLALWAEWGEWGAVWVFVLSAVGVIPLAGFIGEATEALASRMGPRVGGLLNATLGNAAELIITLAAIRVGLLDLVKASITGSILGNLLLVMGFSMLLGGVKNGVQKFDRQHSSNNAVLLILSVLALVVPSFFSHFIGEEGSVKVEALSLGVAVVMILVYALGIIYSLKSRKSPLAYSPEKPNAHEHKAWSIPVSIVVLALATGGVVWLSELLVGAVEIVVADLGLSEFFLGIILIPVIGNVAEHLVAVRVALRDQMELSMEVALSSSLQIALFVAPLLVFISLMMGKPLTLIFNPFELVALGAGVLVAALTAVDGESNWLEGAPLLGLYLILGLGFFLLPA